MQKLFGLVGNHWVAKLLSLILAVSLWGVIKRNVAPATPSSRIQFDVTKPPADVKFDLGNSIQGERKK